MSRIGSTTMLVRLTTAVTILLCAAVLRAADGPATLPSIPDVGEPFDVKSFIAVPFSYRNNAFTLYRHAESSYVAPQDAVHAAKRPGGLINWLAFNKSLNDTFKGGWAHANAEVRDWLESNEFALEMWHRGSEFADAMDVPPEELHLRGTYRVELLEFARLAWLKAARVSAEGEPAGAWTWHSAALRSSAHVAMHAQLNGSVIGFAIYTGTADMVRGWAARPDVSASDLQQALADTIAINKMMPPPSDTLKGEYLNWRTREGWGAVVDAAAPGFAPLLGQFGYDERARRTLNLVYANLLSQADLPRFQRTAVRGNLCLFGRGAFAPVNAKVCSDEEIEGKFLTFAPDVKIARIFLPRQNILDFFDQARAERAALVLGLALQFYYREHGQFPATLADLVKNGYVKSIPPDPFGKGEPLHYRREDDSRKGGVLWSVGIDGSNQEGKGERVFKVEAPR